MLLHIIARGKIGRSPEAELVDRYLRRLTMPYRVTEMPDRGGKLPPVAAGTVTVMLDEKGRQLGSMDFARRIEGWRDAGTRECRFLIGAADGFDRIRRHDLAAHDGTGHAGRTALARLLHIGRSSLSPRRLTGRQMPPSCLVTAGQGRDIG